MKHFKIHLTSLSIHPLIACLCVSLVSSTIVAQTDATPSHESKQVLSATIPDLATFYQIGSASLAACSWDGKDVYFRSSLTGAPQLYRINKSGWPYQLTSFESGYDFFALNYAGDSAIVGADKGGTENSQLYMMATSTGALRQLTDNPRVMYSNVVWMKNDRGFYFASNEENGTDFFVYEWMLGKDKPFKIFGDSLTRGTNNVLSVAPDGTQLLIKNSITNSNSALYLLNLETLKSRRLTDLTTEAVYNSATIMPDGRRVWLIADNNPEQFLRVCKLDTQTGEFEFIRDNWIDSTRDVDALSFSRDFKYMAASVNEDGLSKLRIREVESRIDLPVPPIDGLLTGFTFDQTGNFIFSQQSASKTSDVWLWNPRDSNLSQLTFSSYAGIDPSQFVEPELIHFASFDSLQIPAFLYLPKGYQEGSAIPFLVYAHGGPESQFKPAFINFFQYWLMQGFGILAVNPRGSTGYGRTYQLMDNYKNRKLSLADYKASVEWLFAKGYTKPGMVGIRGRSYGGYVVLGMITEYPDLFASAVCEVGIANYVTFLTKTADYRRKNRESEYGPLTDSMFLHDISPINKAHLIKTPLLLMHGVNDPRVPINETRQMIAAITANGGVVDSLIWGNEGHANALRANQSQADQKAFEFLTRFLKNQQLRQPETSK